MNNTTEPSAKRARTETSGVTPIFSQVSDPSTWTFNPRVTPKSTMIYINDANNKKIRVQLPKMRVPFGVQEPKSDGTQEATSRPNMELDVSHPELVAWGDKIDEVVTNYLHVNSKEYFKKSQSKEVVGELYRHMIPKSDNDYNPLMRTKITRGGVNYATKVFVVVNPGSETTPLLHREGTIDDISRNDWVIPIVDITGIWVANKSAGLSVGLAYVMVYKESSESGDVFNLPGVAGVESVGVVETPEDSPTDVTEAATNDLISSDPFA